MANDHPIWFEYHQTPGRFTARPVAWQGWVIIFGIIGVMVAGISAANMLFAEISVFISLAVIGGALVILIPILRKIIMRFGRPA